MTQKDQDIEFEPNSGVASKSNETTKSENNLKADDIKDVRVVNQNDKPVIENKYTQPNTIQIEHTTQGTIKHVETIEIPTYCGDPISILPEGWAICLLITNIFLPGIGTSFYLHIWNCVHSHDCCQSCENVLTQLKWWGIGLAQLLLTPFVIGYIWSIYTSIQVLNYSRYYGYESVKEKETGRVYIKIVKEVNPSIKLHDRNIVDNSYSSERSDNRIPLTDK